MHGQEVRDCVRALVLAVSKVEAIASGTVHEVVKHGAGAARKGAGGLIHRDALRCDAEAVSVAGKQPDHVVGLDDVIEISVVLGAPCFIFIVDIVQSVVLEENHGPSAGPHVIGQVSCQPRQPVHAQRRRVRAIGVAGPGIEHDHVHALPVP